MPTGLITHLSIGDVDSQIDVPKTAAAYPTNEAVLTADLKLLRTSAPAARCQATHGATASEKDTGPLSMLVSLTVGASGIVARNHNRPQNY